MSDEHPIFDAVLAETEIAVFDLETTGLSSSKNRIIQIAVVRIANSEIIEEGWSQFVHPGDEHLPLTDKVKELTGITEDDLEGQPGLAEVLPVYDGLVEERFVASHVVGGFDLRFMRKAEERHGVDLQTDYYLDSYRLMPKLHPDLERYRLSDCADHYGIEYNSDELHDALVDTQLAAKVLLRQIAELKDKGVTTFEDMLQFLR